MTCCGCLPPLGMYRAIEKEPLIFTVDTSLTPSEQTISLPAGALRKVDWGDGIVTGPSGRTHTYADQGTYSVKVWPGDDTALTVEARSLLGLDQWGDIPIRSITFAGTNGVFSTPHFYYVPDFLPESITSLRRMLAFSPIFNDPNVGLWDTSNVVDFEYVFYGATIFNQPLTAWRTHNATTLRGLFRQARAFDQPLEHFDVSLVVTFQYCFYEAVKFNRPLSTWVTVMAVDMSYMFNSATLFDQDITMFITDTVSNMIAMFRNATTFNRDLSTWCVVLQPTPPANFDIGASAWVLPRPVWGTCP